jgi:hypothetical protein
MPRHPQPVPPIFEPEVAAEAIEYAAIHAPRQLLVGWPTVKVVAGNVIAPKLVDRYLARNGYDAQQTQEPIDDGRPDNLFVPAPGDYASHGVFDREAKRSSALLRVRLALGRLVPG